MFNMEKVLEQFQKIFAHGWQVTENATSQRQSDSVSGLRVFRQRFGSIKSGFRPFDQFCPFIKDDVSSTLWLALTSILVVAYFGKDIQL